MSNGAGGARTAMQQRMLVLGLGNTLLTDDGVGIYLVRELKKRLSGLAGVEVRESEAWGMAVLEAVVGYPKVVIVDAVKTGKAPPGTVHRFSLEDLGGAEPHPGTHRVNLPYLLRLGKAIGLEVPDEVTILGVEAEVMDRFGEELSPALAARLPEIVEEVFQEITKFT